MFHTFEGFDNPDGSAIPTVRIAERRESFGRRVTTLRACTSCRHRKIKCDGEKPCEACRWYKKADACHYSDPRPSRRHVEKLSTTLDEYRAVLSRLFPDTSPESLVHLSRENLLELIEDESTQRRVKVPSRNIQAQHVVSPGTSPTDAQVSPLTYENEDGTLESLQTMPEESLDNRESNGAYLMNSVSDDVNALSLSTKQPSSYLGISSIHAVLKVIAWLDPGSLYYFSQTPVGLLDASHEFDCSFPSTSSWQRGSPHRQPITPPQSQMPLTELQMINSYFTYFQPFTPILDEYVFRETYLSGHRKDNRWLGLLNIVLALGSIGATTSDDTTHHTYFLRSKSYLGLESLGSSNLETIQTLGLMGGHYLHYVSQPNLAYALMGAALRMAAALGLHKEFADAQDAKERQRSSSMDLKRRVWWSLFCLDTWGSGTLGRPSMGRSGPTITVKGPQYRERESVLTILPILENIRFCKIATQVQEALAVAPLIRYHEMANLDHQLYVWYQNLPAILKDHEPCIESISMTRTIMRWRYLNQRMLVNRPTLLSYALRRVPYIALRSEERTAIEKCRALADETIRDISAKSRLSQMSGWNGVWMIFQAVLVPLLGLFLKDTTSDDPIASIESCQAQVESAMITIARLQPWSPTATRTLDVVTRILEASKRGPSVSDGVRNATNPGLHEENMPSAFQGAATSQSHPERNIVIQNELMEDSSGAFMDEPGNQNIWDYLSWSDNTLWPGFPESDNIVDAISFFNPEEKDAKYSPSGNVFFDNLHESTYF
ncbi:hypothetical protein ASPZODRAFT_42946, partial [Penicilliopsis zonata CBS 506.65]